MKVRFFFILLTFSTITYCQEDKYNIKEFSLVKKDKEGRYLYQTEWERCEYIAVFNASKKRIEILLDSSSMEYSIMQVNDHYTDKEGALIFVVNCKDRYGNLCGVTFVTIPGGKNDLVKKSINIEYKDSIFLFRYD